MEKTTVLSSGFIFKRTELSSTLPEFKKVSSDFILSPNIKDYFSQYVALEDSLTSFSIILKENSEEYFVNFNIRNYINMKRLNEIPRLDKFLTLVNKNLPFNGIFICCAETLEERKKRILKKFPKVLAYLYYYFLDFPGKRVFPKFEITRKLHDFIAKGNNKTLSFTEVLGRLVYSGFRIINYKEIDNLTYFVADKEKEPGNNRSSSYGMLFKMKRVGKDGKIVNIYKLRTMHPYSEYIQKYFFDTNNLKSGGKISNDFRITSWGRFLRKYWLDELPMFINLFKGDLKLFGVRPLSEHYLSLYRKELVQKRLKVKPGLIPPYYADMPKTLDEIMESEERYIDAYLINPLRTDIKYLLKALNNILLKGNRSS